MQTFKGAISLELVLSKSDMGKLTHGYVVHTYSAPHIQQGCEIVAAKLELPCTRGYERLGYHVVETLTSKQFRGNRKKIDKRTPSMIQASLLLEQARALLAQHTIKGKKS
jgi:hypothetical protein